MAKIKTADGIKVRDQPILHGKSRQDAHVAQCDHKDPQKWEREAEAKGDMTRKERGKDGHWLGHGGRGP